MSSTRILIVEDEAAIRTMVAFNLGRAGFEVEQSADGAAARSAIADSPPDLILMDWMLPDISGIELTRTLRRDQQLKHIPIIMLTARTQEQDKIVGLDSGADDYITKPFSPRELVSRIKAVLRRSGAETSEIISAGELQIDAGSHRVLASGKEIRLGPTEYRLLKFLMTHPERVYSRSQLLDRVWGANVYLEERTVDVHIRRLRKALGGGEGAAFIQTVRGVGYRFSTRVN